MHIQLHNLLLIGILGLFVSFAKAAPPPADFPNFIVKEHLLKNDKLAIIACDSAENPLENVNGTYAFSLNGFDTTLDFHDGVAVTKNELTQSTFVFIKYRGAERSIGKLYYVSKSENGLNPIRINAFLIWLVPLLLILFGMFFRRFLWLTIILLVVYFYFSSQNGLGIQNFFDTIIQEIKEFIGK